MRKILAALVAVCFTLLVCAPSLAVNRVTAYYGLQLPSSWVNQNNRWLRLGLGQFMYDAFGSTNGAYAHLVVQPVTGLYVAVAPSVANTQGAVYQFLQDDTQPWGGVIGTGGATALPADATQVVVQGILSSATANIGPLTPPGGGGQSINYLIECQVSTSDTTSQTVNTVTAAGVVSQTTANRDRVDGVTCQSKAGTAATTGSQTTPSADAGWVGVGYVAVANGTATITSGMIAALASFGGFNQSSGGGGYAALNATQTFTGSQTFSGTAAQVPALVVGATSQSADLFQIWNAGQVTKYVYVDSSGVLRTAGNANVGGILSAASGSFNSGNTLVAVNNNGQLQQLGGNALGLGSTAGFFVIGGTAGQNIAFDYQGMQARNNGTISTLNFQQSGGSTAFGGSIQFGNATVTLPGVGSNIAALNMNNVSGNYQAQILVGGTGGFKVADGTNTNNFMVVDNGGGIRTTSAGLGGTLGYVPPCYTSAGASCGSTTHIVTGQTSVTLSSGGGAQTVTAVSLSGAAQFSSGSSYQLLEFVQGSVATAGGSTQILPINSALASNGFNVGVTTANGQGATGTITVTVYWMAIGT